MNISSRSFGSCLVAGLVLATVAVLVVPGDELGRSQAPLALVFERSGGRPEILVAIASFALVNGALIQVVMATRVLYGLAAEGPIPDWLGRVNSRTRTPLVATVLCAGVVLTLSVLSPLAALAEATSAIALAVFTTVNAALVRQKLRESKPPPGTTASPLLPSRSWSRWCAASRPISARRSTSGPAGCRPCWPTGGSRRSGARAPRA